MKVREILELLDRPYCVQFQKINGIICTTITDSEGVDPYLDRELIRWGLTDKMSSRAIADIFFEIAPKDTERVNNEPTIRDVVEGPDYEY